MAHKALGICLTLLCASTAVYARPQGGDVVGGAHPFEQGKGSRSDAVIIDDMVDLGDLSANLPGGECVKNPPADAITIGVGISEAGVKVCLHSSYQLTLLSTSPSFLPSFSPHAHTLIPPLVLVYVSVSLTSLSV